MTRDRNRVCRFWVPSLVSFSISLKPNDGPAAAWPRAACMVRPHCVGVFCLHLSSDGEGIRHVPYPGRSGHNMRML